MQDLQAGRLDFSLARKRDLPGTSRLRRLVETVRLDSIVFQTSALNGRQLGPRPLEHQAGRPQPGRPAFITFEGLYDLHNKSASLRFGFGEKDHPVRRCFGRRPIPL